MASKIVIEFKEPGSAEMNITIEGVMQSQIAAAAWLLEMTAQDMHMQEQANKMARAMQSRDEAIAIARTMPKIVGD